VSLPFASAFIVWMGGAFRGRADNPIYHRDHELQVVGVQGLFDPSQEEIVGWFLKTAKSGGPCRGRTYGPLIKSPAETLPQDTQQEESSAKSENL